MKFRIVLSVILILLGTLCCYAGGAAAGKSLARAIGAGAGITVVNGLGREATVPLNPQAVICSGAGSLRLLS